MRCAQKSTSGGNDVAVQQFCLFLAAAVGCTGMYRGATRRNARFSHQLFVFGVSLLASAFGWFLAGSWQVRGKFLAGYWFLAGSWQIIGRFLAGSWQVLGRFLAGSWQDLGRVLAGSWQRSINMELRPIKNGTRFLENDVLSGLGGLGATCRLQERENGAP